MEAKHTLKIDNSRIMDSLETAYLKVTSPSGRTIYLKKLCMMELTAEQKSVFWKFCNDPMIRFVGTMDATTEEMNILLDISKL